VSPAIYINQYKKNGSSNTMNLACTHNLPPWLSSLVQQHMHRPLIQSCKEVHLLSNEPNMHKDHKFRR